jgi:hypothetical protein
MQTLFMSPINGGLLTLRGGIRSLPDVPEKTGHGDARASAVGNDADVVGLTRLTIQRLGHALAGDAHHSLEGAIQAPPAKCATDFRRLQIIDQAIAAEDNRVEGRQRYRAANLDPHVPVSESVRHQVPILVGDGLILVQYP